MGGSCHGPEHSVDHVNQHHLSAYIQKSKLSHFEGEGYVGPTQVLDHRIIHIYLPLDQAH